MTRIVFRDYIKKILHVGATLYHHNYIQAEAERTFPKKSFFFNCTTSSNDETGIENETYSGGMDNKLVMLANITWPANKNLQFFIQKACNRVQKGVK